MLNWIIKSLTTTVRGQLTKWPAADRFRSIQKKRNRLAMNEQDWSGQSGAMRTERNEEPESRNEGLDDTSLIAVVAVALVVLCTLLLSPLGGGGGDVVEQQQNTSHWPVTCSVWAYRPVSLYFTWTEPLTAWEWGKITGGTEAQLVYVGWGSGD